MEVERKEKEKVMKVGKKWKKSNKVGEESDRKEERRK